MSLYKEKTVVIVGLGYVGFPLALLVAKRGYNVIGIDKDNEKVTAINKKKSPFKDPILQENLNMFPIEATTDFSRIKYADIVLVCVPTPVKEDKQPDLSIVEAAMTSVANHMLPEQLIVLESTVNPGVSDDIVIPLLERMSGMTCGDDFYYAYCPERINPGVENASDEAMDVANVARVVGGYDSKSSELAEEFYKSILSAEVKVLDSTKEAEAVKILENCYRDVNIAFINEMAQSFQKIGIDIKNVIDGAATKPYGFKAFYPGPGVGGHCIPVDPYYQIEYAKNFGFEHKLLNTARDINVSMPHYTVGLVTELLTNLNVPVSNSKVAVLGLAYKPGVDDIRESPSLEIIELLKNFNIEVTTYDPYLPEESSSSSIAEAVQNADVVILVTPHHEFSQISAHLLANHNVKSVVDCRNALDKATFVQSGIKYTGIGRPILNN